MQQLPPKGKIKTELFKQQNIPQPRMRDTSLSETSREEEHFGHGQNFSIIFYASDNCDYYSNFSYCVVYFIILMQVLTTIRVHTNSTD